MRKGKPGTGWKDWTPGEGTAGSRAKASKKSDGGMNLRLGPTEYMGVALESNTPLGWAGPILAIVFLAAAGLSPVSGAGRIGTLLIGDATGSTDLEVILREEPLIDLATVPCREGRVPGDLKDQMKYIRQYFPRTYAEMGSFQYIMLITTGYYMLSDTQDRWIHDRIASGAGGFNDQSVLAIHDVIYTAWANSVAQTAFPNDAPAVVAWGRGGDYTASAYYGVVVNRDFPEPVLTPYIPFGVEGYVGFVSRFVIPRQGAGIMAYQTGNFYGYDRVPLIVAWDYGEGRAVTCGAAISERENWFGLGNPYGPDMLMNTVLYSTHRDLIEDVEVFHRIRGNFREFRSRLELLISLVDFIDRFSANTNRAYALIGELRGMARTATDRYLEGDFPESEAIMREAFDGFGRAESLARDLKDSALLWVYLIEWSTTTGVLFTSGFLIWTLMVKRRLYRGVVTTRLRDRETVQ